MLPTASVRALKPALGERAEHDVERDAVAAHDDEIGRARRLADQRDVGAAAGIERGGERIDRREIRRPARTP